MFMQIRAFDSNLESSTRVDRITWRSLRASKASVESILFVTVQSIRDNFITK